MTATLITTGIDQVVAEPGPGSGWTVRFRSANAGLHHQLYVNGRLADWTDTPEQRRFLLEDPIAPLAVRVASVPASLEATDLGEQLPPGDYSPSWIHRIRVVRSISNSVGDVVEILGDHATGELSEAPLASTEIWPTWLLRWGFGEDGFGEGGFGYDGTEAPGMGAGAFGAGSFGMDTDLIALDVCLQEEGTHKIVVRTRSRDGQVMDAPVQYVSSALPPVLATGLAVNAYNSQTKQLTLQIS